jgi:CBS domain-containing protein
MPIGEICVRDVVTATRETTIFEAAQLMRVNHVGDLLVVEGSNGSRAPVGIITDRDIVVAVVALKLDASVISVGDVMGARLETVGEEQGVFETIQHMRRSGIRRMPVVNRQGGLVGIVSVDDLVQLLAEEMTDLSKLISRERKKEAHVRR